jgi:hypothetical protein
MVRGACSRAKDSRPAVVNPLPRNSNITMKSCRLMCWPYRQEYWPDTFIAPTAYLSGKMLTHKQLRTKALASAEVKAEYEKLADEFSLLDEFLKARAAQGLTRHRWQKRSAPRSRRLRGWSRVAASIRRPSRH